MNDYFDWYDYDSVENLKNERAKKYMNLVKKWHTAHESSNEESRKKALKSMSKHRESDKVLKEKAKAVGHYWF